MDFDSGLTGFGGDEVPLLNGGVEPSALIGETAKLVSDNLLGFRIRVDFPFVEELSDA